MLLRPLFEMVYRYTDRHSIELEGPRGKDGLYWMFREGTIQGDRIRGNHKGMNKSTLRVDAVATSDVRGVLVTDDGADIYYEVRGYGLPDGGGTRTVIGSMYFATADPRYSWLNTVVGVVEGSYRWAADGFLFGTTHVYECVAEAERIEARTDFHGGLSGAVTARPPSVDTER